MQVTVIDTKGKPRGKMQLPDEIFAVKANPMLLAQAIRVYLANQRQGTAKVKARGEVRGSGRKIYRQKGTGQARHGDRYAPIFVGGGIAHGPRGNQNVKRKMSKKMRKKALFGALSQKMGDGNLIVVDGLEKIEPKTKLMSQTLNKLTRKDSKVAIILPDMTEGIVQSARNIPSVTLLSAKKLNTYEVLNTETILLMKSASKVIEGTFLGKVKKLKSAQASVKKSRTASQKTKTSARVVSKDKARKSQQK